MKENSLKTPVLSIGMPVYNGADNLREALDCLLSQTFENFELIISDNASSDETELICREYARLDSRVHYFRHDENVGAINNFNWVFNKANQGDYFMWAACDDLWKPDFIQSLYNLLLQNPGLELVFCFFEIIAYDGLSQGRAYDLRHLEVGDCYQRARHYIWSAEKDGKANPIYGIYRRPTLELLGGFKLWGDSDWGADMVFVFSVLLNGNIKILDETLFFKRAAKTKTSEETNKRKLMTAQCRKLLEETKIKKASRRIDYWEGYARAIASFEGFTSVQIFVLRLSLWCRSLKYYRKKYEHTARAKFYGLFS